jgi:hypothetical protein
MKDVNNNKTKYMRNQRDYIYNNIFSILIYYIIYFGNYILEQV